MLLWIASLALPMVLQGAPPPTGRLSTEDPLDAARTALDRGDAESAIALAERALVDLPAASRPGALTVLRDALRQAIREAERAGRDRDAAERREDLALVERRLAMARPIVATPGAASPRPASETAPAILPPPSTAIPDAPPAEPPPPLSWPDPAPEPPTTPSQRLPRHDQPADRREPAVEPAPEPPPVARPSPKIETVSELIAADRAFTEARYADALRLYQALAASGRLPASRNDHWAYCRCVEVVRRINAGPDRRDWEALRREIAEIQRLSPDNWYGEYLRNLAAERDRGGATREALKHQYRGPIPPSGDPPATEPIARSGRPSPAPSPAPSPTPTPTPSPSPTPSTGPPLARGAGAAARSERWQVWTTANFRIFHQDPSLAARVGVAAEDARTLQSQRWNPPAPGGSVPSWNPRCDIYLHSDGKAFAAETGQPEDSPGFSTMGLEGGRVTARRLDLRADHPRLVDSVLPHEVTHVVLADVFPRQQIPRWADEGIAVLAEPESEQAARLGELAAILGSSKIFRLRDLVTMDYPDGRYWNLYYAQSVSLTKFLVERRSPREFVRFLEEASRGDFDGPLARVYGIAGIEELQRLWLESVRSGPQVLASRGRESAR